MDASSSNFILYCNTIILASEIRRWIMTTHVQALLLASICSLSTYFDLGLPLNLARCSHGYLIQCIRAATHSGTSHDVSLMSHQIHQIWCRRARGVRSPDLTHKGTLTTEISRQRQVTGTSVLNQWIIDNVRQLGSFRSSGLNWSQ